MFRTIAAIMMMVGLAGCQLDTSVSKVSNSEQFAKLCQRAPAVHFAFVALAAVVKVSPTVIEREAQAYQVVASTCSRKPQDFVQALALIQEAYLTILDQQKVVANAAPRT